MGDLLIMATTMTTTLDCMYTHSWDLAARQFAQKQTLNGLVPIGACRAVWVHGQDVATPHLMCNCRKHILSLHCTLYVRLCTLMLYAGDHVSLRPVLVIWVHMIQNNLDNARACLGLQAPMFVPRQLDWMWY